ncbi:MAG: hypothetical protein IBJ11_01890 [Phycisphaerales bacterium]|nr:hypothetical protein [Phycisphaerales bacterium]
MNRWSLTVAAALAVAAAAARARGQDFADRVLSYTPAPGQLINDPAFNDPARALGPPVGGGISAPDNSKLVTLGGFGGSIVLGFSQTVRHDPSNPFGVDAIVFGNSFSVGANLNRRWAEAGVIEISRDANSNGVPDDPWYVIPGSHLAWGAAMSRTAVNWSDANPSLPPANKDWYPDPGRYPGWPSAYATSTFALPTLFNGPIVTNPLGTASVQQGIFGYADSTPVLKLGDVNGDDVVEQPGMTPAEFYTAPTSPFGVAIAAGSGGGDAFAIAWAVDPATGLPPNPPLDGFDFIRISTAVNAVNGVFGEISTEVGGVARVRPRTPFFDVNRDGRVDSDDAYAWEAARAAGGPGSVSAATDLDGDTSLTNADRRLLLDCIRRAEAVGMGAAR